MRKDVIIRHLGLILLFNSAFLFISAVISGLQGESSFMPLIYSTMISLVFGIFPLIFVPQVYIIQMREGIFIVVAGWLASCLMGVLPYVLWGGEFTLPNAWFESVSGFTTTGASILSDVESLPKGLLFWRASTHWIGGIGIILFALLLFPRTGSSRMTLIRSELSDISQKSFRAKATDILRIILYVYVGLTLLEILLLVISGMGMFDAITHSFATIATGGFSTRNTSIAYFDSLQIEIIIMVFMVLSGLHFGLLYATITGKRENIFRSKVAGYYLLFMSIGIVLVTLKLYYSEHIDFGKALRQASFQVVSLGTTTGFATTDTASWPYLNRLILIYFSIQCACVGSTSGGLKFDRVLITLKSIGKQVKMFLHPRAVITSKLGKIKVSQELESFVLAFTVLYMLVIFISTVLISAMGVDIETSFSAVVAAIGNVGPGFGDVSSLGNYGALPSLAKVILTVDMLMGRLELFSLLSLFYLKSWR
jgi:trk system potassium uptake protein TrkH